MTVGVGVCVLHCVLAGLRRIGKYRDPKANLRESREESKDGTIRLWWTRLKRA
jgi:hypothetical protein